MRLGKTTERLPAQLPKGETRGAVEQDIVEGVTGAAANGAKPGVGELPRRKRIGSAVALKVAFNAEHPGAGLPVVTGLRPANETGRFGRIIIDRAPIPADIAADIGTGPAVHVERLIDRVGPTPVGQIGGLNRRNRS